MIDKQNAAQWAAFLFALPYFQLVYRIPFSRSPARMRR